MEALGAVASIIAIVGILRKTGTISKTIHSIASDLDGAAEEASAVGCEIDSFVQLSRTAANVILSHLESAPKSKLAREIEGNDILITLTDQVVYLEKRARELKGRLRNVKSRTALVTQLKWWWYKDDALSLRRLFLSVGTQFSMLMNSFQLYDMQRNKANPKILWVLSYGTVRWERPLTILQGRYESNHQGAVEDNHEAH